jgi:hypothetical protein
MLVLWSDGVVDEKRVRKRNCLERIVLMNVEVIDRRIKLLHGASFAHEVGEAEHVNVKQIFRCHLSLVHPRAFIANTSRLYPK